MLRVRGPEEAGPAADRVGAIHGEVVKGAMWVVDGEAVFGADPEAPVG